MSTQLRPVIIDLGKRKRSEVKALERGGGQLAELIQRAIAEATAGNGAVDPASVLPVVLLYKKKGKKVVLPGPFGLFGRV
ncbi:MAG: hypothetical protein IT384_15765 [Deltaproteobacteria bacterium]|nr:hypothetical protein [Deltaproteobacteria bacterium]